MEIKKSKIEIVTHYLLENSRNLRILALDHSGTFLLIFHKIINTKKIDLYLVKIQSNIREGLGQILEYALVDEKVIANKIVIIGPSELQPFEIRFLEKLKLTISIPLEFWQFDLEKKNFINK